MLSHDARLKRTLTDPETGLHNRLSLRLELERMAQRAAGGGFPLGLITVTFPAGAEPAVAPLGRFLAQGIRTSDCLARTGPCELQMLLPHEDVEHAPRVMERLRGLIGEYAAQSGAGPAAEPAFSLSTALDVQSFSHALAGA